MRWTFVVTDRRNGMLISLSALIIGLPIGDVREWTFRDVEFEPLEPPCLPLGYTILEFEELSERPEGLQVTSGQFVEFLKDVKRLQCINGTMQAFTTASPTESAFSLQVIDGSLWEVATSSDELARKLMDGSWIAAWMRRTSRNKEPVSCEAVERSFVGRRRIG